MDKQTLEGIVMELDTMLDNTTITGVEFDQYETAVPAQMVEALRDRLKFVLENTPTA